MSNLHTCQPILTKKPIIFAQKAYFWAYYFDIKTLFFPIPQQIIKILFFPIWPSANGLFNQQDTDTVQTSVHSRQRHCNFFMMHLQTSLQSYANSKFHVNDENPIIFLFHNRNWNAYFSL